MCSARPTRLSLVTLSRPSAAHGLGRDLLGHVLERSYSLALFSAAGGVEATTRRRQARSPPIGRPPVREGRLSLMGWRLLVAVRLQGRGGDVGRAGGRAGQRGALSDVAWRVGASASSQVYRPAKLRKAASALRSAGPPAGPGRTPNGCGAAQEASAQRGGRRTAPGRSPTLCALPRSLSHAHTTGPPLLCARAARAVQRAN